MTKKILCLFVIAGLACCAPAKNVEVVPPLPPAGRIAEADGLAAKASYVSFKKAVSLYRELYQYASLRPTLASKYLMTIFLLALREKEVGISNPATAELAGRVVAENPSLAGYQPYLKAIAAIRPKGKGVMGDYISNVSGSRRGFPDKADFKAFADLKARALSDELSAYLNLCLDESGKTVPTDVLKAFPDSLLIKFKAASGYYPNEDLLNELVARDPEFYEAYLFLGDAALTKGLLLTAEKNFLKAWEGITETPQIPIMLASIYFATEELERSIEFYDKTLEILPGYREATLGKAICLSYLGRPTEAMPLLEHLISLGYLLMGESHYWMAWNLHELKKNLEAELHIEESKGRLPTDSNVFSLAGQIAFEQGDLDKAEKNFKEALVYNKNNLEALSSLGALYAKREDWRNSGEYFERAAAVSDDLGDQLYGRIFKLESSSDMPQARKDRLIQKKKAQLEKIRAATAATFLNAAAGYSNAGVTDRALKNAEKAARHADFKQKAEDFIRQIKKK